VPQLDDTKRILLAVALSAVIFILWAKFFAPRPEPPTGEPPATARGMEEVVPTGPAWEETAGPAEAPEASPVEARPSAVEATGRERHTADTGVSQVTLANTGAVATSWTLTGFEDYDRPEAVQLVNTAHGLKGRYPFQFHLEGGPTATDMADRLNRALWQMEVEEAGEETRVRFLYSDGVGLSAEKEFLFREGSYMVGVRASLLVDGRPAPFALTWGPGIGNHPKEVRKNRYFQEPRVASSTGGKVSHWKDPDDSPDLAARTVAWAGVDDQYFAALAAPGEPARGYRYWQPMLMAPDGEEDDYPAPVLAVPYRTGGETISFFVGPKKLQILRGLGGDYHKIINFGSIIGPIAIGLLYALVWIHEHIVSNYGWAIIILTIAIRLLFFPLTQGSMKKMRVMSVKMKRVQPQQKAIREKYKGVKDPRKRQQMNDEIMALYKKEGVNPTDQISGCLPLLLQMPIFFAFFRMLPAAIELRKEPWMLWIQDLSQADPWMITPVLMGAAMFFSTRRSMSQSVQMEGFQKQIFYMMPIMFTVICLWAPSGLVVYWLFSNLIQMGQQELLQRSVPVAQPDDKGKGKEKGKSGGKEKAADPEPEAAPAPETTGEEKKRKPGGRKRKRRSR